MKVPGDKVDDLLGLDAEGREVRLSDYPGKKSHCISIQKTTRPAAQPRRAVCATDMSRF